MKTLVFCTSYASNLHVWETRQRLWVESIRKSSLKFDQLLIVDDASPTLPSWPDCEIFYEGDEVANTRPECIRDLVIYSHKERLGRQDLFIFPGWYRSFAFGVMYGDKHGFDKIIHIESDAHLVSHRLQTAFNDFREGWFAVWSRKYEMPEIAIQAAAGNALAAMVNFVQHPYSFLEGRLHETLFPFTHVERQYIGDRYGEDNLDVPFDADFSSQTSLGKAEEYYWWIRRDRTRKKVVSYKAPFSPTLLGDGWSTPEQGMCWMVDFESVFRLPSFEPADGYILQLIVTPCIIGDREFQKLYVLVNNFLVKEVAVYRHTELSIELEASVLRKDGPNRLLFLHPNAIKPSDVGHHQESRNLSIAIESLTIWQLQNRPESTRL